MPSTDDTTPFLPTGATVLEDDLDKGIVIKDSSDNEWVWIEVPKSIYTNTAYNGGTAPSSSKDYTKIENVMQTYAGDYRENGYIDTFYSTEQHGFKSETEYNNWKNAMLESVFNNGGFYIGRYEMGTDTPRFSNSASLNTPVTKQDMYPYTWITCIQAQTLSKQLSTGGKQASLMFGIQWDLVLKHIEKKGGKKQNELKTNSISWGNYPEATFDLTKGEYLSGSKWNVITSYTKPSSGVLLTTGATTRNSTLNIYDLAGSVYEWTLEQYILKNTSYPCAARGGDYINEGSIRPASNRGYCGTEESYDFIGCRPALW